MRRAKIRLVIIRSARRIAGRLEMPGDKSISHRAAIIAALAKGTSRLRNFATSQDCAATLRCLEQLGARIQREGEDIVVHGAGQRGLQAPGRPLDCGNSGTTMRLLAGVLAGQDFEATLTGDESLHSRPMQRIIEPLELMGARISSIDGHAPLTIRGRADLKPIEYELLIASAQVKSGILLAGLNAHGQTRIIENSATRDHTERMLRWFGVEVEQGDATKEGQTYTALNGPAGFDSRDVAVPGDISSACYFIAAAALLNGSALEIAHVGLNPSRRIFPSLLKSAGFSINFKDEREQSNEPVGSIQIEGTCDAKPGDSPMRIEGNAVAALIDELPLLALVGSQRPAGIEIRQARELRVKESDRIAATVAGLRAMGAQVEEFEDGLCVAGRTSLRGARIISRGDHRIAMTFAIAGLLADGETEVTDPECVNISYPDFFKVLESIVER